ncbi:MAG: hypothetical protein KGY57_03315, partial [Gammaproteobacteria bacterium]|nr:hypothetical protein [Gammaproteobacteria bacterium]
MRRLTVSTLLLFVVLLSACAQTGQSLRLSPEPPTTGPAVGAASEIGLRVIDAREQVAELGTQQTLRGDVLPLSAAQDIAYVVQLAAAEALKGYDLTAALWT